MNAKLSTASALRLNELKNGTKKKAILSVLSFHLKLVFPLPVVNYYYRARIANGAFREPLTLNITKRSRRDVKVAEDTEAMLLFNDTKESKGQR